eukprot:gene10207-11256_t
MGSSYSLVNDTDKPVWVCDGVNHAALWGSVAGVLGVLTLGAGAAAFGAGGAAVGGAAALLAVPEGITVATVEGVLLTSAQAAGLALTTEAVLLGLSATAWTAVGSISSLLTIGVGVVAALDSSEQTKLIKMKKEVEEKLKDYTRLNPGEKFVFNGSLSLVRTAYAVYDNGRSTKFSAWTGPTNGSNYDYMLSEYY